MISTMLGIEVARGRRPPSHEERSPPMSAQLNVASLLGELTLEEKASLCLGSDFWHTAPIPHLGIPAIAVSDGPHGLRKQPDEGDHVGISGSLPATCFPTASALGSSFDPELARRVGEALGVEARAQGVAVVLGPGINIKRSPLCGRNFEYYSEDPLISGVLGAALVEGIQSQGVGASVKHYAANNQETDRLRVSADVDERTLREIYLPGFERVVTQARPWTVMCAYNKVNGVYASENRWLLTELLRAEWRDRRWGGPAGVRRRRPPRARPRGGGRVRGPAEERRGLTALATVRRRYGRGDRRVRQKSPLPGRRKFPGQPHPGRHRPRRAKGRCA